MLYKTPLSFLKMILKYLSAFFIKEFFEGLVTQLAVSHSLEVVELVAPMGHGVTKQNYQLLLLGKRILILVSINLL